jgi:hypothetical protein
MDNILSILKTISLVDVATWVIVVLVAGFIGQFGRKFAEYLIERARRKRKAAAEAAHSQPTERKSELPAGSLGEETAGTETGKSSIDSKAAKEQAKIEKKLAKAALKQKKKAAKSD